MSVFGGGPRWTRTTYLARDASICARMAVSRGWDTTKCARMAKSAEVVGRRGLELRTSALSRRERRSVVFERSNDATGCYQQ
jgi:hypothetical protein